MFKRGVRELKSVKGLVGEFHMLFCSNVNSNRTVDESVLSTRKSYELNENKGQFARIRDENVKFHSVYADCLNSMPYSTF